MSAFRRAFTSGPLPVVASLAVLVALAAPCSANAADPVDGKVENSSLDAPLFYQLLLGEIELRDGQAGTAYQLMLDAARRTKDEQLFRRATEIALQARAGEQALSATLAWRQALPDSTDALRFHVQLLVALNRISDVEEPLGLLLQRTARPMLPAVIEAVPRFLGRASDHNATALLIERVLRPYADAADTKASAFVAMGRGWLAAGDSPKALDFARRASDADPTSEGAAFLALDLLPGTQDAEAIVQRQLAAKPASQNVRLLYVRTLATSQRLAEAATEIAVLTRNDPDLAPPWLTLGALQLEMKQPKQATEALLTYVRLVEGGAAVNFGTPAQPPVAADDDDDTPPNASTALTQAYLLLAQAAEQQKDYAGAERWLARVDNPQRALEVQARRASLLARQGKIKEARELIRQSPGDGRAKLLAETELLRERKMYAEAEQVMAQANKQFPDDTDLLYEQAMLDERLNRLDVMERLLRRVIELKADHQHAYNALGYSFAERNMRLPEAKELIQKALELSPGEPSITDSMGWVEYRLGNREEAIRLLRDAYQARPDPEIAAHLGEVLWSAGRTEEAKRVFRDGRSRDAQNDVLRETLARLRVNL
ncbi:MAG TPA: tetratricopeptide repeat protein [Caldimonas sp.]|nr:tetratricopeptide repeat protein [Caldimonas sp.]HEX4235873.1 tetratricopeptide repeat protein [Caldimonas sp.]